MANSFTRLLFLREAYELDILTKQRQAKALRTLQVCVRDDDYVRIYRLSEELISDLQEEIDSFIPGQKNRRGLNLRTKILSTLSFLASGSYQKIIGMNARNFISQTSVSRSLQQIINALSHPDVVKKFIRFPQTIVERQKLKERFYEKFKIPGVIGCIDGTLVAMIRPKNNEERYYCRKGYHARNVMLVTDADLNILHVDSSYGGASHDSFIFNHSIIRSHLQELHNTGETVYLLGDSGYAQRPYLMTPILNAIEDTPEAYYNKLHATARNSVERTIGILKGRFRCLLVHRVLHYHPEMVAKIVISCCVLHNICNRAGVPAPVLSPEDMLSEQVNLLENCPTDIISDLQNGRAARSLLVSNLWRSRLYNNS